MGQDATHDCLSRARYLESPHVTHAPVVGAQAMQLAMDLVDGHDLHGEASLVLENVLDVHEVQVAAADVEPAVKPWPVGHDDICALQGVASVVAENVPEVHDEHAASSAVAEPAEKPSPAGHEETVFGEHGATPEAENDVPAAQATWQTVSAVLVHEVFTPAPHVESAAQVSQGAFPVAEKVDPATQAAAFLQQVVSLGLVAPDLLLSYTRDPVHDASANAPPPLAVSPQVGMKAALQQVTRSTPLASQVVPAHVAVFLDVS